MNYYEWVQNQANEQWSIDVITEKLMGKMYAAVGAAFNHWQAFVVGKETRGSAGWETAGSLPPDFRTVAPIIAIERVTRATLMRGIWP